MQGGGRRAPLAPVWRLCPLGLTPRKTRSRERIPPPTASAVGCWNLGTPPSRPHPAPLPKLSRQGSGATGEPGVEAGGRGHWPTRAPGSGVRGGRPGGTAGTRTSRCRGEAGGAERRAVRVRAHPRSAGSRCFGVWSPAPPPSARTGSGLSGTARTLRGWGERHGAAAVPAVPAASPVGAPRALPCNTCL